LLNPLATTVLSKHIIPPQSGSVRETIMKAIIEYGIIIFIQVLRKLNGKNIRRVIEEIIYIKLLYKGIAIPSNQNSSHKKSLLQKPISAGNLSHFEIGIKTKSNISTANKIILCFII
jgi:hypothetical protein